MPMGGLGALAAVEAAGPCQGGGTMAMAVDRGGEEGGLASGGRDREEEHKPAREWREEEESPGRE
jgi:hypothetical protein